MSRLTPCPLLLCLSLTGCWALSPNAPPGGGTTVRLQSPTASPNATSPTGQTGPCSREISLRDAILASLRNSSVILTLSGDVNLTNSTTLDPVIASAGVGQEEGRFNPVVASGVISSIVDEPPNSFVGPGISTQTRYNEASVYARLTQPLVTGGNASIAYAPPLAYLFFPNGVSSSQYNPAYSADFVFRLNQPVLRNSGSRRALTGIRVARARTDQSHFEVQSALNSQIRSVSEAYWSLLAARVRLFAIDSVIPLAEESVRVERLRLQAEQVILADVARAEVQVEELLRARAASVQEFKRRSYQLNQLMGRAPQDASELIPVDVPVRERLATDIASMSGVAVTHLPDLARMRKQIEIRSLMLNVANKDLQPDMNFLAEYRASGLSNNMGDALNQASSLGFPTWTVGMTFEYPLGNRTARSRAAAAEMELTRDRIVLRRSEERAGYNVAKLIAALDAAWERHESADRQVQQAQAWLSLSGVRYKNPLPSSRDGNWLLLALVDYQNAMKGYVDAITASADTLAEYNIGLARLDEAQGISMARWCVDFEDVPDDARALNQASSRPSRSQSPKVAADVVTTVATSAPATQPSKLVEQAVWQGHSTYRSQFRGP